MADDATVRERVQELTWALLDKDITDDEVSLLDTLLISDDRARDYYVRCVQLHCDLMAHFADDPAPAGGHPPLLSFLTGELPTGNLPTNSVE